MSKRLKSRLESHFKTHFCCIKQPYEAAVIDQLKMRRIFKPTNRNKGRRGDLPMKTHKTEAAQRGLERTNEHAETPGTDQSDATKHQDFLRTDQSQSKRDLNGPIRSRRGLERTNWLLRLRPLHSTFQCMFLHRPT